MKQERKKEEDCAWSASSSSSDIFDDSNHRIISLSPKALSVWVEEYILICSSCSQASAVLNKTAVRSRWFEAWLKTRHDWQYRKRWRRKHLSSLQPSNNRISQYWMPCVESIANNRKHCETSQITLDVYYRGVIPAHIYRESFQSSRDLIQSAYNKREQMHASIYRFFIKGNRT